VVVGNGRRGYSRTIAATIEVRRSVEKVIVENCTKRRMEEEERMHRKKKIKRQDRGDYGSAVQRQEANSGQENGKKLGWEEEGLKDKRENTRGRRAGQNEISETRASERARTSRSRLAHLCERRSLSLDVK